MPNRDLRFYADVSPVYPDTVRLTASTSKHFFDDGKPRVIKDLVMEQVEVGDLVAPFLQLSCGEAQGLMDALWHAGIRPTEGRGSAGAMAATQQHLEDMRKIAFSKLEIPYDKTR